jgi:hypothetical protein
MITSVIPLTKPEWYVYTLRSYYQQQNTDFEHTIYVTLDKSNFFSVNDVATWTSGAASTGKVLYVEGLQYLIALTSGNKPVSGTIISVGVDTSTVTETLKQTTLIKKLFANYSKPTTTANTENEVVNEKR